MPSRRSEIKAKALRSPSATLLSVVARSSRRDFTALASTCFCGGGGGVTAVTALRPLLRVLLLPGCGVAGAVNESRQFISVRESLVSILFSLRNPFGASLNPGDSTGAAGGMAVLRGSPCGPSGGRV